MHRCRTERPTDPTRLDYLQLREHRTMDETALLHNSLMVGAFLFGIGMIGFLTR